MKPARVVSTRARRRRRRALYTRYTMRCTTTTTTHASYTHTHARAIRHPRVLSRAIPPTVSPRDTQISHPMTRASSSSTARPRDDARATYIYSTHIYIYIYCVRRASHTYHILRSAAAATTLARLLALVATEPADRAATEVDGACARDVLIMVLCVCQGVFKT